MQLDRLKSKKERLIEMRTDGEISKEEFASQKSKIDSEISRLTAECEKADSSQSTDPESTLCWEKIHAALDELIDLSQPTVSRDVLDKFISKVVPESKTHFRWYLNLDGNNDTIQDMVIEGRKNHAVVTLGNMGTSSPIHAGEIILFSELGKASENKKYRLFPVPHRQLSRAKRINLYFNFVITSEMAEKYRKETNQYLRAKQWEDITVEVFI